MKTLYIIDINSLVFRAYYGIKYNLTTKSGIPINAVYGVVKMLNAVIKKKNPTEIIIAYDSQTQLNRSKRYEEYKANRSPVPEELKSQFPILKEFISVMGVQSFEVDGFEADDIIASLAVKYQNDFDEIHIMSSDKDLMQLVNENTFIYDSMKNVLYDADAVYKKFSVNPDQIGDYLAIVGDVSDNIPGVKGIGPKGTATLLKQFKTLDGIYQNISLIKGKKREHLINSKKNAYLSRELVALEYELPIEISIYKNGGIDLYTNELLNFYYKYDLNSIIGNRKFKIENSKEVESDSVDYEKFIKLQNLEELSKKVEGKSLLSISFTTTTQDHNDAEIIAVSISLEDSCFVVTDVDDKNMIFLKSILEDNSIKKICYNAKFLIHLLDKRGIELNNFYDTMIASYVVNATATTHLESEIILNYLNYETIPYTKLFKNSKSLIDRDEEKIFKYVSEKSFLNFKLKEKLDILIKKMNLLEVFEEQDIKIVKVLAKMEKKGIKVDTDYLESLKKEFNKRLKELESDIYKEAGKTFNINSPKQLSELFFDDLQLPVITRTKTGYSTDEEVLNKLTKYSRIPKMILEYRSLMKLVSTYLEGLLNQIVDSSIHTTFNSTVTATGRLSSSNPNLQNIPTRTENGKKIRQAFVAREGKTFIIIDYSQIELRILAHISKDPTFTKAFISGEDIHSRTASEIFNTPIEEINKFQRYAAKTINFGLLYGMGEYKLSKELGIRHKEAREYIRLYFEKYGTIKKFKEETIEQIKKDEFIKTEFGRIRYFKDINSRNRNIKNHAERMAFNTLIQGTAADLIKLVMIKLSDFFKTKDYQVDTLLQIHDELIFEVDSKYAQDLSKEIKVIMEESYKFSVPLIVDIRFSDRW